MFEKIFEKRLDSAKLFASVWFIFGSKSRC
jgi:hypothetical protein